MGSFQVSAGRSLFQRLTPLAWLLLGLVVFFGLAFVIVGVPRLLDTLAAQPAPAATATPTQVAPTAAPVVATPEPTAPVTDTAAFPAFWSTGMYQDAAGQWWPAEEVRVQVQQMVEEHFRECGEWFTSLTPDEFWSAYTEIAGQRCYTGSYLGNADWSWKRYLDTGIFNERSLRITNKVFTVQAFSPDGLTCIMGETYLAGYLLTYDAQTATWIRNDIPDDGFVDGAQYLGLALTQMRYDSEDGRWKMEEFLEWIPRPAP